MKRIVSSLIMAMLFLSVFAYALTVQPARAQETIIINPDGSISSPVLANITTSDNITYTFTGNNYLPIIVNRSNIIINGMGHTLQASGGTGFSLTGMSNVTIKNTTITNSEGGIALYSSSGNLLSGNNVTANGYGICLSSSSDNVLSGNNVTANNYGIQLTTRLDSSSQMAEQMFSDMVAAEVSPTFPYTYEGSSTYTDYATEETMQAVTLYVETLNNTYLKEAEKTANWLSTQSDVRRIAIGYNTTSGKWATTYSTAALGNEIGYLALICHYNSSYDTLLQKLVDVAQSCIQSNYIPYSTMNMSNDHNTTIYTYIDNEYALANALTYSSLVLNNATIKDLAYQMLISWRCGSPTSGGLLPAYSTRNDGSFYPVGAGMCNYTKEDEGFAMYLYACEEFLYCYPTNLTMQTRILNVAKAGAQDVWNATAGYWNYLTDCVTGKPWNSGTILGSSRSTYPVHGFGMTDEAMLIAGLLAQNTTWINDALRDYTTNVIDGGMLTNGLVDHMNSPFDQELEAENSWNQYARRFGIIAYNYNHNATFLQTADWLFGNMTTKMVRALGWSADIHTTPPYADWSPNTRMPLVSAAIFVNRTSVTISNWTSVFQTFGFPQWGDAPAVLPANGYGICLSSSSDNVLSGNNVTANNYGICLESSSNNTFYHNNFIGNTEQVYSDDSPNIWDNGYPSGGNYWSDYTGVDKKCGPYQNVPGSDGIGDIPYIIDPNNTDYYPLMNPYSTSSLSVTVSPASTALFTDEPHALALSNFTVSINIATTAHIGLYEIAIQWNPSVLSLQTGTSADIVEGPWMKSFGSTLWTGPTINNTAGTATVPDGLLTYMAGASGNGTMFYVHFHAITASPMTNITILSPNLSNGSYLLNGTLNGPVTIDTVVNGSVLITKAGDLGGYPPGSVVPQFGYFTGTCSVCDIPLFIQCYRHTAPPQWEYLGDLGGYPPGSDVPQFFLYTGSCGPVDIPLFILCYRGQGP